MLSTLCVVIWLIALALLIAANRGLLDLEPNEKEWRLAEHIYSQIDPRDAIHISEHEVFMLMPFNSGAMTKGSYARVKQAVRRLADHGGRRE